MLGDGIGPHDQGEARLRFRSAQPNEPSSSLGSNSRCSGLNWSERRQWPYSLPVALFRFFAGGREFNPLAVVFQPLAWPRRFRFYGPFQAFKHGRPQEVEEMRRDLLNLLDVLALLPKSE